jgi:hypothetical protein
VKKKNLKLIIDNLLSAARPKNVYKADVKVLVNNVSEINMYIDGDDSDTFTITKADPFITMHFTKVKDGHYLLVVNNYATEEEMIKSEQKEAVDRIGS